MAHMTSTGHALSDSGWLDLHSLTARVEYDAAIDWIPIARGHAVLDAGCGVGGFLKRLSEAVGPEGSVTAIDLAPENISRVISAQQAGAIPGQVITKVANVLSLPFGENTFDVVWIGNVLQYLTHDDFKLAMSEALRVLRPNGILALKDYDVSMLQMLPIEERRFLRMLEARVSAFDEKGILGTKCGPRLPALLRELGLSPMTQKGWMVERWAPLEDSTKSFVRGFLKVLASAATGYNLSDDDKAYWSEIAANVDIIVESEDFRFREGFVVTVIRK